MNTNISIRDEIRPPDAWYAWIDSPEREAAMRASGQLAADATDSDASSVRAPDGFSRSLSIRDVGAAPEQQDGAVAALDMRDPHAIMRERLQSPDGRLPSERIEAVDGGGGDVVDMRNLIPGSFFGAPQ